MVKKVKKKIFTNILQFIHQSKALIEYIRIKIFFLKSGSKNDKISENARKIGQL
jgi:hypothetical protein